MRIFKTKKFAKFARKERIADIKLCKVVKELELGQIDADLGGGVIKQKMARLNQGSSGGYRSIILYRQSQRVFFVHGFLKTNEDNISATEERDFKDLAPILLSLADNKLADLLKTKELVEVECNEQN